MKYCKPEIHSISATEGHATCADGSNATPIAECVIGGEIAVLRCRTGLVASARCGTGTAAPAKCNSDSSFGVGCVSGTNG